MSLFRGVPKEILLRPRKCQRHLRQLRRPHPSNFSPKARLTRRFVMAKHQYITSPPKMSTMPPGVPYIIGNEAAERFSYYGMNSILTIFMTKYLLDKMGHLSVMQPANAEAWYHTFVSVLYILPILGAILADAVFGKFRVVLWLSIVYCFGHLTLALMGSPVAHAIEPRYLLAIGLVLIAMGAGGIKPCVSTNVGDQFGETNKHLLTRVFNWFYFSINAGSALSTLDRKSTRLNSSHRTISYAVFCLKKNNEG